MGLSLTHLLILLIIVFIVFGPGKLAKAMGEIGKGVRSLRDGMKTDESVDVSKQIPPVIDQPAVREKDTHTHHQ